MLPSFFDLVVGAVLPVCISIANVLLLVIRAIFLKGRSKDFSPKDKLVVVTGCDSGFGEMSAHHLTRKGYKIVAACYTEVDLLKSN